MSKKAALGAFLALAVGILPFTSFAADNVGSRLPWEKFSVKAGYFFVGMDDKVTVGTRGAGVAIDVENLLGLKTHNESFRFGGSYRIGESRRHRVDLEYFWFNRSAAKTLGRDITVDNTIISTGTPVNTTFNLQFLKGTYSYSFFQDDRMDLAGGIGLYVMPIKFELSAPGLASESGKLKFTAPLPVLGLRGDFAITPRVFFRSSIDFFYIAYQNFTGALVDTNISVEYQPWEQFGFGLGLENFRMGLKAEGNDYPSVSFQGDIKTQFLGVNLYARYFF